MWHTHTHTHTHVQKRWHRTLYGVVTVSRLLKSIGLFCRISSLLQGSFAKETYNLKESTTCSHPVVWCVTWNFCVCNIHICMYICCVCSIHICMYIYVCMYVYIYITHTNKLLHRSSDMLVYNIGTHANILVYVIYSHMLTYH